MEHTELVIAETSCETVEPQDHLCKAETTETGYNQVQDPKEADRQLLRKTIENLPQFDVQIGQQHPLKILLAEDSLVNLKITLWFLKKLGYHADVAFNGIEAIDALRRQSYDVILMDAEMPEMDGREATMAIRKNFPADHQPRIIAMTAHTSQGDLESFLSIGMDDYVTKPLELEEMVRALLASRPLSRTTVEVPAESNNEQRIFSKVA
ncbi:MAG: response regulator [Ignavibacteriales bacterium]|nr:response regulator [Ignavibacteriales bacterium]